MRQLRLVSELPFLLSSESELNLAKKQRDRELARLQVTCKWDRNLKVKIQQVLNGTETKDISISLMDSYRFHLQPTIRRIQLLNLFS